MHDFLGNILNPKLSFLQDTAQDNKTKKAVLFSEFNKQTMIKNSVYALNTGVSLI